MLHRCKQTASEGRCRNTGSDDCAETLSAQSRDRSTAASSGSAPVQNAAATDGSLIQSSHLVNSLNGRDVNWLHYAILAFR